MRVFLQKMVFNGIKNIQNNITIEFANKRLSYDNLEYSTVKAIYGPNGAGKTAVVDGLKIYQALTTERAILFNKEFQEELLETMNKVSKSIFLSFTAILMYDDNTLNKIQHDINLIPKDNDIIIAHESLKLYKNVNSDKIKMELSQTKGLVLFEKIGQEKVVNYEVSKRSIVDLYQSYIKSLYEKKVSWDELSKQDQSDYGFMINFFEFSNSLYIISEDADEHSYYFNERKNNHDERYSEDNNIIRHSIYDRVLNVKDIDKYKAFYDKIESFIKVFKSDLKSIRLDEKKINLNEVKIETYFDYGDYQVHMEFESAGIKKLVKLYSAIHNAIHGGITVIDEFDANINDVYLTKIIEYVIYNAKGQLIFTTHNTSPMDILRNEKRSIDFINENGELVNWIINGNASPAKMYHNGAVKGLPFNIDSFDFIGLFDEDNE